MTKTTLDTVHSADVLIVGGGIAGLSAALSAKEADPSLDVLVVDRAAASKGWAGAAARTAGLLSFVTAEDDPEEFVRYCLEEIGMYLNDQLLLRELAHTSRHLVERLCTWGVEVGRDGSGKIAYAKWPFPWGTTSVDPDMCRVMAVRAKRYGVRFADRLAVTDLLRDGGRVSGAVGFHVVDGTRHAFKANAVILASGSQNYDVTTVWCGTGNGILAAYRAGAEMRNAEFGNMCDFARVDPRGWLYYGVHGGAHTAHDHMYGADGENISQKHRPGLHSSMDPQAALAWYRETLAGNGPITVDLSHFSGAAFFTFHPKALAQMHREEVIANYPESKKFEVVPGFIGELSCLRVDRQMAATVPGLFGAGNVAGNGSARGGANPTPPGKIHGTGILNALFMGTKAGEASAVHARALRGCGLVPALDEDRARELLAEVFAPLGRRDGVTHGEVIRDVQGAVAPVDYSVIKTEERMKEALGRVLRAKEKLPLLAARDPHELARCVDAGSMALCAELFYRASLLRTESRGFHYREDFPERDDGVWLKWIVVKQAEGKMVLTTEDVPLRDYPYPVPGPPKP